MAIIDEIKKTIDYLGTFIGGKESERIKMNEFSIFCLKIINKILFSVILL